MTTTSSQITEQEVLEKLEAFECELKLSNKHCNDAIERNNWILREIKKFKKKFYSYKEPKEKSLF